MKNARTGNLDRPRANPVCQSSYRSVKVRQPIQPMCNRVPVLFGGGWISRFLLLGSMALWSPAAFAASPQPIPDKLVVLTFDDAVKSHRTFVAPLLKELGFNATFFVTHKWMDDRTNFMTWEDISEIHQMG